jgi:hypothetical protein
MSLLSARWWFENRETGEITIAQFPNWPLWGVAGCWTARLVLPDGSPLDDALGWAVRVLWLIWGADELIRGVNPWRRALGTGVIGWQVAAVAMA